MSTPRLTFIPWCGLANRMRAIASAANLFYQTNVPIDILWLRTSELNARFSDIFKPINIDGISIKEGNPLHRLILSPASKKNFLSKCFQYVYFDNCFKQSNFNNKDFDYESWCRSGRNYMYSCYKFGSFSSYRDIINSLFIPINSIQSKINNNIKILSDSRSIGVHVRRSDNTKAIRHSPIESFFQAIDSQLTHFKNIKIFLATDDEATKQLFFNRYSSLIYSSSLPASRNNLSGIQNGIIDLYTLASTDILFGSYWSSYSGMAATLGGQEYHTIYHP